MSHSITEALPINPAIEALRWWLLDNHYSPWATDRVIAHTEAEGTPTGSPYLDADDEGPASEAYVGALPSVPYGDPAWGSDEDLDGLDMPPLAGGSPEPDEAAWRDYAEWSAALERRREMTSWYERNPIAAFNADRPD